MDVCTLYGVDSIIHYPYGVLECSYIEPKQLTFLRARREELLEILRPQILNIVEAWQYPDNNLKTAIGMRDGNPYERLYEWTMKYNEFNKMDWTKDWEENVKSLRNIKPKL
jgi:acyl-CoA oxidase